MALGTTPIGVNCKCCKCKVAPVQCSLTGVASGHDIVLNWSYSGYAVNRVKIIKQPNWWFPDEYDPNWEEIYSDDGTTNVRTLTVPNGECMRYVLYVCNDCGCCDSKWTDGRTTRCDCFQCSEVVPVASGPTYKTITRRYSGSPNIQCGCQRGKVTAMAVTMSGMASKYSDNVDRTTWNPNRDTQFCSCPCTGSGLFGIPINHNRVWRYNQWNEVLGADCMNGTFVFTTYELNFVHPAFGRQCVNMVSPSYYKLGQVTAYWMEGQTNPCAQTNPELLTHPVIGPCIRNSNYTYGPFTAVYDLYLIGSNMRRFINNDPMNTIHPWIEDIPLDGSTIGGDACFSGFATPFDVIAGSPNPVAAGGPRLVTKLVSTNRPGAYYQNRIGKTHLHPACGAVPPKDWWRCGPGPDGTHRPWIRQLEKDRCSWRLDGKPWRNYHLFPNTLQPMVACSQGWDYITPPNLEMIEVYLSPDEPNYPMYGGSLMAYANVDGIFTTEFQQIWP